MIIFASYSVLRNPDPHIFPDPSIRPRKLPKKTIKNVGLQSGKADKRENPVCIIN